MPSTVVSSPHDVTDPADVVLLTTKLGDLAEVSAALPNCLHEGSLIIPLQNGIDAHDMVVDALPPHHHDCVGWGTVHIVSYVEEPGVIYRKGTLARFFIKHLRLAHPKPPASSAHGTMMTCPSASTMTSPP